MLIRWFINDSANTGTWRLKGHATESFWDWMSSWAVMASSPEDLGFDGSRFVLPPMVVHRHKAIGEVKPMDGQLFAGDVSATSIFAVKRETTEARADVVAGIVAKQPNDFWVIWCDTDIESAAITKRLPESVEVKGSLPLEVKERRIDDFSMRRKNVIVTKTGITGSGLNWQHCHSMIFCGRTFSYESYYQAVRRCWRFGQKYPVDVHLIMAEGEEQIGRILDKKAIAHSSMRNAMISANKRINGVVSQIKVAYDARHRGRLPAWL